MKHSEYEWANPYSIRVIYLMVILRLADYFQFDSSRIQIQSLKIKTFSTPFSEFEHLKHLAIKFVKPFQNDSETLLVEASPENSFMFLSLTNLFADIQKEFDTSWAILGEIYGKDVNEKKPKLKFRRIKSNLDDKRGVFVNSLEYIPEENKFTTDIELLKLLAAPLYGNDPSYGVRELLQNSVDACREQYIEAIGSTGDAFIRVSLIRASNVFKFVIEDNGKGMSLFEIKNYFLKAGSSFRKSSDWKKEYTDDLGKSIIARNGKFGIGVLAAFLLGSEIHVDTKSVKSKQAYEFSASIDSNQIEILKSTKSSFGTKIEISISEDIYNSLLNGKKQHNIKWYGWYKLPYPKIEYQINVDGNILNPIDLKKFVPNHHDGSTSIWNKIEPKGFKALFWTYAPPEPLYDNYELTCNGIVIPNGSLPDSVHSFLASKPKVNLFDFDGLLNLNLNRNSLDLNEELSKEILTDIYSYVIAKLLCLDFKDDEAMLKNGEIMSKGYSLSHPALKSRYYNNILKIGVSKNGYFPFEYNFLKYLDGKKIIEIVLTKEGEEKCLINNELIVLRLDASETLYSLQSDLDSDNYSYYNAVKVGQRVILQNQIYEKMFKSSIKSRIRSGLKATHKIEPLNFANWVCYTYNFSEKSEIDFKNLKPILHNVKLVKEFRVKSNLIYRNDLLGALIEKYFGNDIIIPYSLSQRKKKYKLAFKDFSHHINKYL